MSIECRLRHPCWVRIFILLISLALLFHPHAKAKSTTNLKTFAQAYSVIDVKSGRIVLESHGDSRLPIASLTKVMTALLAIEYKEMSDIVKVSHRAHGKEGSSIYLQRDEQMSLHTMLYGLMLRSGNDAATAIAEHVGGSEDGFVYLMNEKAVQLGMINSHFVNPHGLDHTNHYSSANDLAKLTAYALRNVIFQEIVQTKIKSAPNPNQSWDYRWLNKNKMLTLYEGADGVKTGYTTLAHRTLISSATRNGQQFAVVTLNDGNDWNDHRKLLDYAFANYPLRQIATKNELLYPPNYYTTRDFEYPLHQDEISLLRKKIILEPETTTSFRLGKRGVIELYIDQRHIASIPMYEKGSERLKIMEKNALRFTKYESKIHQNLPMQFIKIWNRLFTEFTKAG